MAEELSLTSLKMLYYSWPSRIKGQGKMLPPPLKNPTKNRWPVRPSLAPSVTRGWCGTETQILLVVTRWQLSVSGARSGWLELVAGNYSPTDNGARSSPTAAAGLSRYRPTPHSRSLPTQTIDYISNASTLAFPYQSLNQLVRQAYKCWAKIDRFWLPIILLDSWFWKKLCGIVCVSF